MHEEIWQILHLHCIVCFLYSYTQAEYSLFRLLGQEGVWIFYLSGFQNNCINITLDTKTGVYLTLFSSVYRSTPQSRLYINCLLCQMQVESVVNSVVVVSERCILHIHEKGKGLKSSENLVRLTMKTKRKHVIVYALHAVSGNTSLYSSLVIMNTMLFW